MKGILLVDSNESENWEFYKALNRSSRINWELLSETSNHYHGDRIKNLFRYIKYFTVPLKVFFKRKQYDHILAWQQFYGLILAFYCSIFRVRNAPKITVMTFIYKAKRVPVIRWLYDIFINYIVHSGYVTRYIVFSESERIHYSHILDIGQNQIVALKLGIKDVGEHYNCEPESKLCFLSAGRSNRDYKFLLSAWDSRKISGEGYNIKVICDELPKRNTENIIVLNNCHGEKYLFELGKCYAVILPLDDEDISSGQLVALQAMMLGKPVIATKNNSITDYIIDGYNGIIIEKNAESMLKAIENLQNDEYYQALSRNARECFERNFSLYSMGQEVGELIG